MKKIILMLAISVLFLELAGHSQVRVGLIGGVDACKMTGRIHGDGRSGIMGSLILETNLGNNFSFYPTLSYVQKGVTEPHPSGTLIEKQYVALRYMEFTPNFIYNIGSATTSAFFLGVGPSLDVNIPSKRVTIIGGTKSYNDLLFGTTPENDVKGIDYGANVVVGWRTAGGFVITFNYNKGIRNLTPDGLSPETKNQYFGVQLGAYLNNGKK